MSQLQQLIRAAHGSDTRKKRGKRGETRNLLGGERGSPQPFSSLFVQQIQTLPPPAADEAAEAAAAAQVL